MSDGKTTYMYRQVIEYADFSVSYLSSLRANSVWYEGPAADWLPPYPGSEGEHAEYNVYDDSIFLVISGKISTRNMKHHDVDYVAGQGMHMTRSKTRYRIVTLEDATTSVCLKPKAKIIYERSLVSLNAGETTRIDPMYRDNQFFIAKGKVKINGIERTPFHMMKVVANTPITIECLEECYVLRMWEN